MNTVAPEHFSDPNYNEAVVGELKRGADPEILDDIGIEVYGETPTLPEGVIERQSNAPSVVARHEETKHMPDRSEPRVAPRSPIVYKRRQIELPGRNGLVNSDKPITSREAKRGLTVEEVERRKAANHEGFAAAREILRGIKAPRKP